MSDEKTLAALRKNLKDAFSASKAFRILVYDKVMTDIQNFVRETSSSTCPDRNFISGKLNYALTVETLLSDILKDDKASAPSTEEQDE